MKEITELKELVKGIFSIVKSVKEGLEDDGKINISEGFKIGLTAVKEGLKVDFKQIPEEFKDLDSDEKKELYLLVMDELGVKSGTVRDLEVEGFISLLLKLIK